MNAVTHAQTNGRTDKLWILLMSELAINDSKNINKNTQWRMTSGYIRFVIWCSVFWRMRPKLWGPGSRTPTRLRSKEAWWLGCLSSIVPSNYLVATRDPGFLKEGKGDSLVASVYLSALDMSLYFIVLDSIFSFFDLYLGVTNNIKNAVSRILIISVYPCCFLGDILEFCSLLAFLHCTHT